MKPDVYDTCIALRVGSTHNLSSQTGLALTSDTGPVYVSCFQSKDLLTTGKNGTDYLLFIHFLRQYTGSV